MAHKRVLMPNEFVTGDLLTSNLLAIGMLFAATPPLQEPNIEDTLVAASIEGIINEDYRVLSLLVDWFGIHFERVNIDRLVKIVILVKEMRVKVFWSALAQWQKRDWRLKKLQLEQTQPRFDLMGEGTGFQIEKYGEDKRFIETLLRVPANLLRIRLEDILTPVELSKRHRAYFYRVMIGPSYRADMWAAIEHNPSLTPAQIARETYGSFSTAWETKRDWNILRRKRTLSIAL